MIACAQSKSIKLFSAIGKQQKPSSAGNNENQFQQAVQQYK